MAVPHTCKAVQHLIDALLDPMPLDDLFTVLMLVQGLTWDGPQRDTLVAYAHGITDQFVSREAPHA